MKRILLSLLVLALAGCSPGEETGEIDAGADEEALADEAEVPAGVTTEDLSAWSVGLDDPMGDVGGFHMVLEDDRLAVNTGPAGVAWRPVDLVMQGDFVASARFDQRGATPGHQEGYGILVGGQHLGAPDQEYVYFLVRSTGEYLIKRRQGESTETLVDWKSAEGVRGLQAGGEQASNTLAVEVRGEEVRFQVNGATVETLPRSDVRPYGHAGIRVNHNLDLVVSQWSLSGEDVGQGGVEEEREDERDERPSGAGATGEARDTAR